MQRKMILAVAACATLGTAALTPGTASAAWAGHGSHGGWHGGYVRPGVRVFAGPVYGGCVVRRWVHTPHGPALRWIDRCY